MLLSKYSIKTNVLFALTIPVITGIVILSFLIGNIEAKYRIKELNEEISLQSKIIKQTIGEIVVIGDYASLENILQEYSSHPDIKNIIFETNKGVVLKAENKNTSTDYPLFLPIILDLDNNITNEQTIQIGGINYGKLKIQMNTDELFETIWNQFLHITFALLIIFTITSLFIVYILNNTIITSLNILRQASAYVGKNHLKITINNDLNPEIKEVLVAFNNMSEEIKTKQDKLFELNNALELKANEELNKRILQEKMLLQQSKMALMGEMIGAIAHQWRQPLNSLALLIQDMEMAQEFKEIDDNYIESFKTKSLAAIKKMDSTIEDFRNFFKQNSEKSIFSIEDALLNTLNIMSAQIYANKIILINNSNSKNFVLGLKSEFEHVILILISNAIDALIQNKIQEPIITINTITKDNQALCCISDNGHGIPLEIEAKIFDPYFTTKGESNGTGIGLYLAKEIIEKHMNGRLVLENSTNGARFIIELSLAKLA